jgi:hypothetical protein
VKEGCVYLDASPVWGTLRGLGIRFEAAAAVGVAAGVVAATAAPESLFCRLAGRATSGFSVLRGEAPEAAGASSGCSPPVVVRKKYKEIKNKYGVSVTLSMDRPKSNLDELKRQEAQKKKEIHPSSHIKLIR